MRGVVLTAGGLLALLLATGCAELTATDPVSWRAPGFRPSAVRRPAVYLRISVDRVGLGSGPFTEQERASVPEQYEAAVQEALNALGILPTDLVLEARPSFAGSDAPLTHVDVRRALGRAREVDAEYLLILDARLSRRDLIHCRAAGRPLAGVATFWQAAWKSAA